MNKFNPENWEFWLRLGRWSHKEAAIILAGYIPTELNYHYMRGSPEPLIDIYAADYELEIIKGSFSEDGVKPREFFEWCKGLSLSLNKDLVATATKIPALKVKASDFIVLEPAVKGEQKVSPHWGEIRSGIYISTLQLLDKLNRDNAGSFFLPGGGLNASKISEKLDAERIKFPKLNEDSRGASLQNIQKSLRDGLAGRPAKK